MKKQINCKYSNHVFIIFCIEHVNPLGQVRSLGENGIFPYGVIIKSKIHIASKSKYFKKVFYVDTIEEGYKLIIDKWGNNPSKNFIISSDDIITSFLDQHYDFLKDKFFFNTCCCEGAITKYMNKQSMSSIAERCGLNIIQTIDQTNKREIYDNFPVIIKTIDSLIPAWKENTFICNNAEEYEHAIKVVSGKRILVQKYIEKKNEFDLEGYSYCDGKEVFIPICITFNYVIDGYYSTYLTGHIFNNMDLLFKVKKMIRELRYNGVFEIEFLVDKNDDLLFLEINFRNSCWGYLTTFAKSSSTIGWIDAMLEQKHIPKIPIVDNFSAMAEFSDFKYRVLEKRMSFSKWFKDYKKTNCKLYYNKKDVRPFWTTLFGKVFRRRK